MSDRDDELPEELRPDDEEALFPDEGEMAALRALLGPSDDDLAAPDHEALLAMTLGEDVATHAADEVEEADGLRRALDGDPDVDGAAAGLAELAEVLRVTARATEEIPATADADHEALLAVALGTEPEISAADREAATELAEHLDREPFAASLRAARGEGDLDVADAPVLLALAFEVTGGEAPTFAETTREAATTLADDLDGAGEGDAELLPWTQAVRAAAGKLPDLDQMSQERRIRASLEAEPARGGGGDLLNLSRVPMWLGAVVAAAAALVLLINFGARQDEPTAAMPGPVVDQAAAELKAPRSTAELFDPAVPFEAKGGESDRVDRILTARASDLRNNRFAAWGVR